MKVAQNLSIQATIVDEKNVHSPYGIIVHSDKAENVDNPLLSVRFPQPVDEEKPQKANKSGFWSILFHKD